MGRLIGISGSLRKASLNSALLRAACELCPELLEAVSIRDIPLYDGDLEAAGTPDSVLRLKRRIIESDGLLLVSPEYNNSLPGVLKNTVDWLSRSLEDSPRVFLDKPVAVIGATPGGWGTLLCQDAWLSVFRGLGAHHWAGGRLLVSGAHRVFDDQAALVDEKVRERLEHFVRGFARFAAQHAESGEG
ncbi:MAG: NAD(P)H-dependent oxidoreductase [Xanthomonadales bacterium]|nr:NAD(P)H-dependent oxidoreductase [Xanthomonadales bacterium]